MAFPKVEGYVVTEKLGSGSYSTVFKAFTKVGARTVVAVKCVDKSRVKHSHSAVDNLITEIRLLKTLTHPHIVQMKEFTWDEKNIYIITEYCCGGDLSKYIHKYGRVPERQVLYFLQQLASALKFLREKGVVHMDLKPHNLLLHKESDGKYKLKVADFGFAQYMCGSQGGAGARGSPLYMAPEMLLSDQYDARVDLWSVGVIMYECLLGRAPYSSKSFKELMDKIRRKAPIEIPQNSSLSSGCRDLLSRLLQHNPDDRIQYEEFFSHPYLDLEHMPCPENYQKAVSLMKQAIEHDSGGRLRLALCGYCEALRHLLPEVHSCRGGAQALLRAKVTRYMERAEEIKAILNETSAPNTPVDTGPQAPMADRCTTQISTNQSPQVYTDKNRSCYSCVKAQTSSITEEYAVQEEPQNCTGEYHTHEQTRDDRSHTHEGSQSPKASTTRDSEPKKKFDFGRLFKKKPTEVPYLTENDIKNENEEAKNANVQVQVGEATNEMCKIS